MVTEFGTDFRNGGPFAARLSQSLVEEDYDNFQPFAIRNNSMSSILTTNASSEILPTNMQASRVWDAGGKHYDHISGQIADAIAHCVDRLDPQQGERILDVATGTGWTARRINARGANVTGVDFSRETIRTAQQLDDTGRIDFMVGDAEALPFEDATFDRVISTFGIIFCDNPKRAAPELARVCKPGGRIVVGCWDNHGGVREMFQVIQRHKPRSASGSNPFAWANEKFVQDLFEDTVDIAVERAVSFYRENSAVDAWNAFVKGYGPVRKLYESLEPSAANALRRDFEFFHEGHNTGVGVLVPRPYVVATGAVATNNVQGAATKLRLAPVSE